MTELDAELPELALELIEEFGKALVYTLVGNTAYDPTTSRATRQESPLSVKALVEDKKGVKTLTVAGGAFPEGRPGNADTFVCDGSTFVVPEDGVTAFYSGELIAIYQISGKPQ